MLTDIGEFIVGAHLQLIEECDFIDYNVRPPGEVDYLLKVNTVDIHSYEKFLHKLLTMRMVGEVNSRMMMSIIKCTTALPLELSELEG